MFEALEALQPVTFCDYFRVPYRVVAPDDTWHAQLAERHPLRARGQLRARGADGATRALSWPQRDADAPAREHRVDGIPIFCRVVPDDVASGWLRETGATWTRALPVRDAGGALVASTWRDERGNVFFPFDPAEAIENYWSEGYQVAGPPTLAGRGKQLAMRGYYRARPVLPRASQIAMRRLFSRLQARSRFPRWPVETALHDLYRLLFRAVAELAGGPVPWLAPWPAGHTWALVLTHDVETDLGYRHLEVLREVELAAGRRSSWNFVPRRYAVEPALVERLRRDGFEVGVHGLYHDGRDLASLPLLKERLPAIRDYAARWQADGFRSPATHRNWEWMPLLGFDYDSSYPDTDPFEPQAGGCCSLLPFFNRELVELPLTLPQDHTLFVILQHADERAWNEKAARIAELGGMALLNTHPDYMLDEPLVAAYRRFLARCGPDTGAWQALPREVSAWWRRRAASRLEPDAGGWRIVGPAAGEGQVALFDA